MCFKVECRACGKTGWGGCGKHLVPLYNGIQKGDHCTCRSWPGVVVPVPRSGSLEQPAKDGQKDAHQPPPPPPPAAEAASCSAAPATAGSAGGNVKIA